MKYLTRRYPYQNDNLWGDFESFFNAPSPFMPSFNSFLNWGTNNTQHAIDLFEDEGNYIVQAEVPGFDKKEIEVELEKDRLTLKGARKMKNKKDSSEVSFQRSVSLPDSVDSEKVSAQYENGILTVTIPKAEVVKPLRIEVKS